MKEVWKEVKGFENSYLVSNIGNVKSKDRYVKHWRGGDRLYKSKQKKTYLRKGYVTTSLKQSGFTKVVSIHRLVAIAFLENKDNKQHVNHKNGIKTDNRVNNLEWCSPEENTIHAVENRLIKTKLTDEQAIEVHKSKLSNRKLAVLYGVDSSIVWRIKNKKAYKHLWQRKQYS